MQYSDEHRDVGLLNNKMSLEIQRKIWLSGPHSLVASITFTVRIRPSPSNFFHLKVGGPDWGLVVAVDHRSV